MLDELDRVRALHADEPNPDDASYNIARAALRSAIGDEPRRTRTGSRRPLAGRQRRRRFVLAGGMTCAALAVAGLVGFDTTVAPQSALAAQMGRLAHIAAGQQPLGIPGPGQYLYTESDSADESDTMANGQECAVNLVQHRQIWIATDGSGAINESNADGKFTSAADQAACAGLKITDPASQDNSWSNSFPAGGLGFPTNDWKSLSTDPATLLKQVHRLDGGPNTPGEWFTNVADMLRESDAPAAIRSALYHAAALIPGVKLMGAQQDPTGGSGLGVGYDQDGQLQSELIFNRQTAGLQAEEYFDQSGKLAGWTVYKPSQIVDSHPRYPATSTSPAPAVIGSRTNAIPGPATGTGTTPAGPTATGTTATGTTATGTTGTAG